jgi:5-methylcytosine-specific restriction endonuclease McrA
MDSSFYGWTRERWARMNPREQQAVIFTAFGGRCVYCKREVDIPLARDRKSLTRCVLDHKIPAISGGSDDIDNIVLSCQSCNSKKSDGRHDRYGASVIEQTDGLV